MIGSRTLGFGRRRYGRLFLATAGLLVCYFKCLVCRCHSRTSKSRHGHLVVDMSIRGLIYGKASVAETKDELEDKLSLGGPTIPPVSAG